jgi:hypothetical protein
MPRPSGSTSARCCYGRRRCRPPAGS